MGELVDKPLCIEYIIKLATGIRKILASVAGLFHGSRDSRISFSVYKYSVSICGVKLHRVFEDFFFGNESFIIASVGARHAPKNVSYRIPFLIHGSGQAPQIAACGFLFLFSVLDLVLVDIYRLSLLTLLVL